MNHQPNRRDKTRANRPPGRENTGNILEHATCRLPHATETVLTRQHEREPTESCGVRFRNSALTSNRKEPNMQTILSGFLKARLLPIGEDDEKLHLLESAASELAKRIKEKPILVQRSLLVGLDPAVPETDPVHKLVETAVSDKWETIANKIGPNPVQVYRAVI